MSKVVICSECGEIHPEEEMELTFRRPDVIVALAETDRAVQCKEDNDLCALQGSTPDQHRYFVRGTLSLPVQGRNEPYNLGIWAETKKENFDKILELWSHDDQASQPPFDGIVANEIPLQETTIGLQVSIQLTGVATRPSFKVTNKLHKLYREQLNGISAHQAHAYTRQVI